MNGAQTMSHHTDSSKRHSGDFVVIFDSADGSEPCSRCTESRGGRAARHDPAAATCQGTGWQESSTQHTSAPSRPVAAGI
jgi:hypothetical protein